MTYDTISFFSPLESPTFVGQVAGTSQPEAEIFATTAPPSNQGSGGKGYDTFLKVLLIAAVFSVGLIVGMEIEKYLERRRQTKDSQQ